MLFITYGLTFTSILFSTLLHTRGLQHVHMAAGVCSECCFPSRFVADDCLQTCCENQNKHNELCLLYHRIAYERRWLSEAARTCSFQLCFVTTTRSHLYSPDDGLQPIARSYLTAASCKEPAAHSQQPASTNTQQATSSKHPAASIQ